MMDRRVLPAPILGSYNSHGGDSDERSPNATVPPPPHLLLGQLRHMLPEGAGQAMSGKMLGRLGWHGQCACCNGPREKRQEKRAEQRQWRHEAGLQ